jgi:hypothetical protein
MRKAIWWALAVFLAGSTQMFAQQRYTEGGVERVVLVSVVPGKMNAVLDDLKQNLTPVYEEEKKQGIITEYKIYLNTTTTGDWNVAIVLVYKNMAALDGLAAKAEPIAVKHYGSAEKAQAAADKRAQLGHIVSSNLVRQITLK